MENNHLRRLNVLLGTVFGAGREGFTSQLHLVSVGGRILDTPRHGSVLVKFLQSGIKREVYLVARGL